MIKQLLAVGAGTLGLGETMSPVVAEIKGHTTLDAADNSWACHVCLHPVLITRKENNVIGVDALLLMTLVAWFEP